MTRLRFVAITAISLVVVVSVPLPAPPVADAPEHGRRFEWNQDSLWLSLESVFSGTRASGCANDDLLISSTTDLREKIEALFVGEFSPGNPDLELLEANVFESAAFVAACPEYVEGFLEAYGRMREGLKLQSQNWDFGLPETRERVYRSLYGGRAAVEEVMLQNADFAPAVLMGKAESSATPSVVVQGVTVHSGDMLVSRGGAPTSALISRGNDYPGNFSHVALVHIDENTGEASVVEAHIEVGVAVATIDQYLSDKKLRIMVLRPRADLPQILADPLLPHRAATRALERARSEHVPYDFEMDYEDPSKLFCSEVASSVYKEMGVELWTGISTITSEGLRSWLSSFGVTHFVTQEPSDLEYDPQLVVVAEWRHLETLWQDHIDNAVIDAMLEGAERGDRLSYSWYQLPIGRVVKGYSWAKLGLGFDGVIPEGMSPSAALRSTEFSRRQLEIAGVVTARANRLEGDQGYPPPYWALVDLARGAVAEGL
jgi:hypothetical protein